LKNTLEHYAELLPQSEIPLHANEGLYFWAVTFVAKHQMLTEATLVPLIDLMRHDSLSSVGLDLFHKKLHTADSKIYNHSVDMEAVIAAHNGDHDAESYYLESQRMCYNVSALYSDDDVSIAAASDPVVRGETGMPLKQLGDYSEKEVYEKFIQL
jgi:hypothetical protein